MSKGPGKVQQPIIALIGKNHVGAWTTTDLCREVFRVERVSKKHRVSVNRALHSLLRTAMLPDGWKVAKRRRTSEACLYNARNAESVIRANWLGDDRGMGFDAFRQSKASTDIIEQAKKAKREKWEKCRQGAHDQLVAEKKRRRVQELERLQVQAFAGGDMVQVRKLARKMSKL